MNIDEHDRKLLLAQLDQLLLALRLCKDMLGPESLGFAVTEEVRNRAREVFGIPQVKI